MATKLQYPTGSGDLQPRTGFHPAPTSVEELAGILCRYPYLRGRGIVDDGAGPGINLAQFEAALALIVDALRRAFTKTGTGAQRSTPDGTPAGGSR